MKKLIATLVPVLMLFAGAFTQSSDEAFAQESSETTINVGTDVDTSQSQLFPSPVAVTPIQVPILSRSSIQQKFQIIRHGPPRLRRSLPICLIGTMEAGGQ